MKKDSLTEIQKITGKLSIPEIAKGTVIPLKMSLEMLKEEERKKQAKKNYNLAVMGAVCGVVGALTSVAALIISIIK